ncbi:MAG: amino acid adenylation domain-containing protein [Acidobacteria bacterium]|nr:amino acid adenylation domain-containing protein [Acidobacteriota bacterium]
MRHITQRIEHLSPAKRALLEMQLRERARLAEKKIQPRENRTTAPLAFNQESLWFLEQLNPNTATYNLSDAMRLRGSLDAEALQQTLETIVARHEALRTTFATVEGEPQQIIHETQVVTIYRLDLSQQPEGETEMLRLLSQEAERPFDLTRGPLVRFWLVGMQEDEHVLFVLLHHILSDGWSVGVFWQEFAQLYQSFAQGQHPTLAPLPIQFGDYTEWQRQQKAKDIDEQLAYWKTQLDGAPALLELPTDRPRPAVQSFRGAQATMTLPDELRNALKNLSKQEGATLFMTLLATFNVLLTRYTGQEDIVLGSPLAGRSQQETENLIGFFANVLVMRTDVTGNPSFRELLKRTKDTVLGAFSHQEVPFEKLVAELRPERSLSYNPIFQTAFALQNESAAELKIPGLQLQPVKLGSMTAKFDLLMSLCEVPQGLRATVEYSTDLFDPATIERLLHHYQNLLQGIVVNPLSQISELPLLSAAEQHQLLVEWNNTATDYPRDLCIQELFEAQAERTPEAVAVVAGGIHLTYRELNRRANQVAHALRADGIQPDTLVGILTERSLLTVIGILGILKAGAAYLPLDASSPSARLQFMLEDAQAPVILTQQKMLPQLPETQAKVICLDRDWEIISKQSEANPSLTTTSTNLAYAIYTSGSTGQPKGTAIVHRAVNRLVFNTNYVQLDESDCIAQVATMSFDAATFELWGALLHGARLVIIAKDIALSPQEFAAQLREHHVTTMFVTTALFNLLSREAPMAFSTLKTLMFGGEACDPNCIREVLKNGAPNRLLHVYGPTENTTFSSWHLIEQVPENAATVPIGRPISNSTMYLLDRYLKPVPVGVPGEVYVGGDGLAREYLHQPELTAEKFRVLRFESRASNPESRIPNPESRLYRTGDLARYLPDGSIEFIGRKDHQIKLRGFRIELGEIEAALLAHPAIQDCLVVVANGQGEKRLLAYYVVASAPAPTVSELRDFMKQRLPDYMLPASFFKLDEMPLTPNGKVDRQKLPQPTLFTEPSQDVAQATDELEVQLTRIWEQVLNVKPIGVRDNFFALGGHSLIAVRLFTAIEKAFGQRLPLATLFQFPTIEQLAEVIRQQGWQPSWHSLVALRPQGTRPPFFCVHAVGGNVLEYHNLARYCEADQPFYGLQSVGLTGKQKPLTSIEEMAAHYIQEMRLIQPHGPYYLGGRSFGGSVAFEMARQLREQGEEVGLLAMLDTYPLGWEKLLPPTEVRQYEKQFLKLRVKRHFSKLRQLSLTGKANYILSKAEFKKRKFKNFWWRVRNQVGAVPADSLRNTLREIEELNYLAARKYTPHIYQGKVTFFCAEEEVRLDENVFGWQRLAAGGVDVVRVPGDHQTMIHEPQVQELARSLMESLHRTTTPES